MVKDANGKIDFSTQLNNKPLTEVETVKTLDEIKRQQIKDEYLNLSKETQKKIITVVVQKLKEIKLFTATMVTSQ